MTAKPRPGKERRRAAPIREAFDIVLIVCEGSKTEPTYFKALCDDLRLSSANVLVLEKGVGSSPGTVVALALEKFRDSRTFDKVFCVFDRDAHGDYDTAVDRCNSLRQVNTQGAVCPFVPITSNPSFEYWVYLHFQESAAPIVATGGKSCGDVILGQLKREFPAYSKADAKLFSALISRIGVAARRARRINAQGNQNPHTRIVDLVTYLAGFRGRAVGGWVEEVLREA